MTRLEQASALDRIGDRLQRAVFSVLRPRQVRDALHGVWYGHPLHPAMVDLPVGAWLSAAVLDLTGNQRRAATTLIGVGTGAALPAAITGVNDWAALAREQRRVGLVHATANTTAVTLYVASLTARMLGRHTAGRILSYLGLTMAGSGAYLGGHLAYRQAAQVNQAAPEMRRIAEGWHRVGDLSDLPEGELVTRRIDDVPVLVYRDTDRVSVMLEHCAHETGPLSHGTLTRVDGSVCVVCPWHGSTYRLTDGAVVHGPSANDQQTLHTQVVNGVLEARLP